MLGLVGVEVIQPLPFGVQILEDYSFPVGLVAESAQVGERLFWTARLALVSRQQVAEVDQVASIAGALVLRHDHDAGDVVLLGAVLLLAEVADEVAAVGVVLGEDVEEKGLNVEVEGLVVEEELGDEAQVLAIDFARVAVDFKD